MGQGLTDVVVALLGVVGVVFTAVLGYLSVRKQRLRTDNAEAELRVQSAALDFSSFIAEWTAVYDEVSALFEETCVDRFLIFRAWNGKLEPRWATSVHQMRKGGQYPISYVHVELDSDYVDRVRQTVKKGVIYFETDPDEDTLIHRVYRAEGVTASIWCHLSSDSLFDARAVALSYCSFATHDPGGIPPDVQVRCRLIASRLRGVALSIAPEVPHRLSDEGHP